MNTLASLLSKPEVQIALAIATLLGGVAAFWFFWDKVIACLRHWLSSGPAPVVAPPQAEPVPHAADRALFEKILAFLPFEPAGRFLQQHDFAGSFHYREWSGIHDYITFTDSPECHFQDSALEALRLRLTTALREFLSASFGKIWSAHPEGYLGVPDEWLHAGHPRYGEFWPAVKEIEARARTAYEAFDLFVRKGRAVLGRH